MNATHSVTRLSSVISLLTQFSGNLQWDTSERNEAYGDKEVSSDENYKEALLETSC